MRERESSRPQPKPVAAEPARRSWFLYLILLGLAAVVVLALLPKRRPSALDVAGTEGVAGMSAGVAGANRPSGAARDRAIGGLRRTRADQDGGRSPEAVVATRVATFGQTRREIARELARQRGQEIPADVEQFFDALQAGNWGDIKGLYNTISAMKNAPETAKSVEGLWPAIAEAFGTAAVATTWPANELLAYGESVAGSLRPGTVYISGTDAGRYIPALFGDAGGAGAMIVAPDAFADPAQLEYLALAHPERFGSLNREDLDKILRRDQAPVDSGSVPGVDPKSVRGDILRALIERNPGTTFAVDGSFDLGGLAADIVPSGAVLEIRPGAGGAGGSMPAQRGAETADYWRATATRLEGETSLEADSTARREYAQMAMIQGKVLADQNLGQEAELIYRAARQMAPSAYEPLERLASHLAAQGRPAEALALVDEFTRSNQAYPDLMENLRRRLTATGTAPR